MLRTTTGRFSRVYTDRMTPIRTTTRTDTAMPVSCQPTDPTHHHNPTCCTCPPGVRSHQARCYAGARITTGDRVGHLADQAMRRIVTDLTGDLDLVVMVTADGSDIGQGSYVVDTRADVSRPVVLIDLPQGGYVADLDPNQPWVDLPGYDSDDQGIVDDYATLN